MRRIMGKADFVVLTNLKDFSKFSHRPMRHAFGDCVFDGDRRQLYRDGRPVHVSPKAYLLLELLIERAPGAVSKEAIQGALWPDTFVTEASLTNIIAELRAAIGDRRRGAHFIRTIQRFGYAFEGARGAAGDPAPPAFASYRLQRGQQEFVLAPGDNLLGREPGLRVCIDHASVSRRHARISIGSDRMVLEDLRSRNGTFLDGRRIDAPVEVRDGATIGLGPVTLTFVALPMLRSTKPDG